MQAWAISSNQPKEAFTRGTPWAAKACDNASFTGTAMPLGPPRTVTQAFGSGARSGPASLSGHAVRKRSGAPSTSRRTPMAPSEGTSEYLKCEWGLPRARPRKCPMSSAIGNPASHQLAPSGASWPAPAPRLRTKMPGVSWVASPLQAPASALCSAAHLAWSFAMASLTVGVRHSPQQAALMFGHRNLMICCSLGALLLVYCIHSPKSGPSMEMTASYQKSRIAAEVGDTARHLASSSKRPQCDASGDTSGVPSAAAGP
mmetsp:Transcript_113981/g.322693  ORF Transcript_113981/g.322693 Transcript_113981/m.322693 type:complete len:259 (+) Transcript_113981:283-1059(+)